MESEDVGELFRSATQKIEYPAKVLIDGATHTVMLQAAGDSTIREPKKSFNMIYEDGQTYQNADEVRLGTTIRDTSMLRTLLSVEVFKQAGTQASHVEPAFFYINDTLMGLYFLIERVNGSFFKNHKLHSERYYSMQANADFSPSMALRIEDAFSGSPKPANLEAMRLLAQIATVPSDIDFENQVFAVLDRESVIRYMTGSLLINHYDGFIKNMFLYQATGHSLLQLVAWDFDSDWVAREPALAPWDTSILFNRIANLPTIHTAVFTRAKALIAGTASYAALNTKLDAWKAQIREAYEHDPILGQMGHKIDDEEASLLSIIQDRYTQINAAP